MPIFRHKSKNGQSDKKKGINLITPMDKNKVTLEIFGLKTIGLVDTGAAISCISQNLFQKINSDHLEIINTNSDHIYGVGGEQHKILGKVKIPISFKGLKIHYQFYIVHDLQYPLILGDDFLSENKCFIHYPTRTLYLHEGSWEVALISTKSGKARSARRFKIPANSIADVPVKLPDNFINDVILLEPNAYLNNIELLGATCLVKATKSGARLQVVNPTENAITIPKFSQIANIAPVFEDSIQELSDDESENRNCKNVSNIEIKSELKNKAKLDFDLSSSDLTYDQQQKLQKFLNSNKEMFARDFSELGKCSIGEHVIETHEHMPMRLPPYRATPTVRAEIEKQVDIMREHNIIVLSTSPYTSPVVLCKKRDNSFRFCIDYRKLNSITKPMSYPLPHLSDVFDVVGEAKATIFSVLDLCQGFLQLGLHKDSREKAAFVTHSGVYEWTRMPFGLRNSSITFSRVIGQVLQGLNWKNVLAYIDDILVFSKNFEDHLKHLEQVFSRLKKANLKLKPSKCQFGLSEVQYLGHILSKDGVKMDPKKIDIVRNYPAPRNQKETRQFLGLCNYYRKFVEGYSKCTVPLNALLQKENDFKWTTKCQESFDLLKSKLTSAPILAFPDMTKPFQLTTDASGLAIGYILGQKDDQNRERIISFGGRALRKEEKKWTVSELECLAVLEGIKQNKVYLSHNKFTVYTDHKALIWLHKIKDTDAKLGRWALQLQNYNFDVVYREGKNNKNADAISRIPYPPTPEDTSHDEDDVPVFQVSSLETDSPDKSDMITEITFEYDEPKPVIAVLEKEQVRLDNLSEVAKLQRECTEIAPLIKYLETGELPDDNKKAKTIVLEKDLYRFGSNGELIHQYWPRTKGVPRAEVMIEQVVLPKMLRQEALQAYHDCQAGGGHKGFRRTYAALQQKYYWDGMYNQVYNWVISCDECQRAKKPRNRHPAPLMPLPVADTFERWHMDILTGFPKTKENYQHVLLVVDSMSRWCEAFPLVTQNAKEIANVLYKEVFTRFGSPKILISDKGQNFCSKLIQALSEMFHITRHTTSSYHPMSNTTCERMNSTIAQTLRTYCSNNQENWAELIPSVMMALRMSPNTESTGFSPYHMVFGKEMNIPFDISVTPKESIGKSAQEHISDLIDHLKIVQKIAKENVSKSQEKTKSYYDRKAQEPKFKVGDRVLLQCMKVPKGLSPKLHAKWVGPFYINQAYQNTYKLRRANDHKLLKSRIHANRLKLYEDPRDHRQPILQNDNGDNDDTDDNDENDDPNDGTDKNDNDETVAPDTSQGTQSDKNDIDIENSVDFQDDQNDSQFLAEKLLAMKRQNGTNFYRVKWVGYKKTTWIPEEDIGEGLLTEFYTKHTKDGKVRKRKITSCFNKK